MSVFLVLIIFLCIFFFLYFYFSGFSTVHFMWRFLFVLCENNAFQKQYFTVYQLSA